MPVLASNDSITPRSAVRYRPIGDGSKTAKTPVVTNAVTPVVPRASRVRSRPADDEVTEWQRSEDEDEEQEGSTAIPARRTTTTASKALPTTPRPKALETKMPIWRAHPLLYLGVGMLVMLTLWTLLTGVVNWAGTTLDDIHYGRPRTFQTDAFVGHNEAVGTPSHFIAINLHGRIEVVEMPGGDPSKARIYLGPQLYGAGDELVPVTLRFADVNGDHQPDMIIRFQGSQIVFINDQGGFRPLRPEEQHSVEQFLQQLGP